jgi:hypothetical protein
MKASVVVAVVAALLAACSPSQPWKDGTGQHRGFDEMRADNLACYKAEMPSRASNPSQDQLSAAFARIDTCMALRGWEPTE